MPNNQPPVVNMDVLAAKERAASQAVCDYGFWWGATAGSSDVLDEAARRCVGMKVYMTHTYGPLLVNDPVALMHLFQAWPAHRPIAVHAEGASILTAILLGQLFGKHVHICHVSQAWQMAAIRRAKEQGCRVTCEVTPHHLFLTEEDARRLGSLAQMRPPLGSAKDQQALWSNLDAVDMLATDHAPHTLAEKGGRRPPPGVPGLETALPLMLTAVADGRLSLEKLVDMVHGAPARLFHLTPPPDTFVTAETGTRREVRGRELQTRCKWSPFEGMTVRARVLETWVRGTRAWGDGQIQVSAGFGQRIGHLDIF